MANMCAQVATQANGTKGENDIGENDVAGAEVPNNGYCICPECIRR